MRRVLASGALALLFVAFFHGTARADDCSAPSDCQGTVWVVSAVAALAAAVVGGAIARLGDERDAEEECAGACTCTVEIDGKDVFYRDWGLLGRGPNNEYIMPATYQAKVKPQCRDGAVPGSLARIEWSLPEAWKEEGRSRASSALQSLTLEAGRAPKELLEELKHKGSSTFTVSAVATLPFRCEDKWSECTCSATKSVTVKACISDEQERDARTRCDKVSADVERREAEAKALIESTDEARLEAIFAVQAHGEGLHYACKNLREWEYATSWASFYNWVFKLSMAALSIKTAVVAGVQHGAVAGLAGLKLIAPELAEIIGKKVLEKVAFNKYTDEKVEEGEKLQRRWAGIVVDLRIAACEPTRRFADALGRLDRKDRAERDLEAAIKAARDYRGCVFCDVEPKIERARETLALLHAEAVFLHRYRRWIEYCVAQREGVAMGPQGQGVSDAVCNTVPPVPPH